MSAKEEIFHRRGVAGNTIFDIRTGWTTAHQATAAIADIAPTRDGRCNLHDLDMSAHIDPEFAFHARKHGIGVGFFERAIGFAAFESLAASTNSAAESGAYVSWLRPGNTRVRHRKVLRS